MKACSCVFADDRCNFAWHYSPASIALFPWQVVRFVKDTTNETYLLYQCGTSPPDLTDIGLPASTKVFSVPLRAVNVEDTSALHFMVSEAPRLLDGRTDALAALFTSRHTDYLVVRTDRLSVG